MSWIFTPEDRREMLEAAKGIDPAVVTAPLDEHLDRWFPRIVVEEPVRRTPRSDWR